MSDISSASPHNPQHAPARFSAQPATPAQLIHCKTVAVVNQKGGVGKTTTAINLVTALALEGIETLLVDVDPQANATSGLGVTRDESRASVYDVLLGQIPARDAIVSTAVERLSLIPGTRNMIGANVELVSADRREFRLRDALQPLGSSFRFIVLDCPPALDLLTLNALVAAETLLVPMQAEYFALEGVSELISTLDKVAAAFNQELSLEGVLLTMFDERTNLSQQVRDNLRAFFGDKMFVTTIPRNIRLAEAPSHGKPVALYDPRSRGAESYRELCLEFLERNGLQSTVPRGRKKLIVDEIPPPRTVFPTLASAGETKKRLWPFGTR